MVAKQWVKEHGYSVAYRTFSGHKYLLRGSWKKKRDATNFAENQRNRGCLARVVPINLIPTLSKKKLVKRYAVYVREKK